MALTTGSAAAWSDINTLYNNLSTVNSNHGCGRTITKPSKSAGGSIAASDMSNLISNMAAMHYSETHLSGAGYTDVSAPSAGSLISATLMTNINNNINNMLNTCHYNPCDHCNQCSCDGECAYCWQW